MLNWMRGMQKKAERITAEAVNYAQDAVWHRTEQAIRNMSTHEARGYVRARSRVVVSRAVAAVTRRDDVVLPESTRATVVANALESVVDWAVQRRQLAPATLRRAA